VEGGASVEIEAASGTTVGELSAIRSAFDTLASDGLTPTSQSALRSFENSLVTDFASGTPPGGRLERLARRLHCSYRLEMTAPVCASMM
jgi:hypothetical protein